MAKAKAKARTKKPTAPGNAPGNQAQVTVTLKGLCQCDTATLMRMVQNPRVEIHSVGAFCRQCRTQFELTLTP